MRDLDAYPIGGVVGADAAEGDEPVAALLAIESARPPYELDDEQFTAALVLKLVDRGKLSLTDTLGRFFTGLTPGFTAITVEQTLNPARPVGESSSAEPPSMRPRSRHSGTPSMRMSVASRSAPREKVSPLARRPRQSVSTPM